MTRDKKVYTRKISEFYRVNKNAPKDVSADFSRMVNYVKSKLNAICTELLEVYSYMRAITVAGYIQA